jgi:hypothetical protein
MIRAYHRSEVHQHAMNAPTTALLFVGLLLTILGLFVAGNITLIALGIAALFGAGLFGALAARSR